MDLEELLSQDFCAALEYRISHAWSQLSGPLRWYWCDGILPPELSAGYSVAQLQRTKHIPARGWIGNTPTTTLFTLTIRFGPQALRAIAQQQSLQACIPGADTADWLTLNVAHETLTIQLL